MKSLRLDTSIIIKSADKGGAVVIMDKTKYIQEAMHQLNNTDHYSEVPNNILTKITKEINEFITLIQKHGHISQQDKEALTTQYPRLPCLYTSYPKSTRPMYQEDQLSQQHKAPRITYPPT